MIAFWLGCIVVWIGSAALLQPDGADVEDAFDGLDNSRYLVEGLIAGSDPRLGGGHCVSVR